MTIEQMVRDLLTQAIKDGLVARADWTDPDPQYRSSGELVGVANMLTAYLANQQAHGRAEMKERAAKVADRMAYVTGPMGDSMDSALESAKRTAQEIAVAIRELE